MSSEHIYDRAALVIKGEKNDYIALFSSSHSSNVDPYIPEWNLYSFSKKEDALNTPLRYAYYADEGMNRGERGQGITGEFDIFKWRQAIASPTTLNDSCEITVTFLNEKFDWEHHSRKLERIEQIAVASDIQLSIDTSIVTRNDRDVESKSLYLDLGNPKHVDLIYEITRDGSDPESHDSHKRLMVSNDFIGRKVASYTLGWSDLVLRRRTDNPVFVTRSTWKLHETILKFAFPVEGQNEYKDEKFAVVNWLCRIVSTHPFQWFCEKLVEIEKMQPGSAESAYRKFKALMKKVEVSSHEGMTIEVMAALSDKQKSKMYDYVLQRRKSLFDRCLKPDFQAMFTESVSDHITALFLSEFVECNMCAPAMFPQENSENVNQRAEQLVLLS